MQYGKEAQEHLLRVGEFMRGLEEVKSELSTISEAVFQPSGKGEQISLGRNGCKEQQGDHGGLHKMSSP